MNHSIQMTEHSTLYKNNDTNKISNTLIQYSTMQVHRDTIKYRCILANSSLVAPLLSIN